MVLVLLLVETDNTRTRMAVVQQLVFGLTEQLRAEQSQVVSVAETLSEEVDNLQTQVNALSGVGKLKRPTELIPKSTLLNMDPLDVAVQQTTMLRVYESVGALTCIHTVTSGILVLSYLR